MQDFIKARPMRLFYERQGDGDMPLVFVHGYACSHEDWQAQVLYRRFLIGKVRLKSRL
jgi:pimeloyl-ACP methyl ester carboxylesterase